MANKVVMANQDDPAGSYVTFVADPAYCFPDVPRSPVIFLSGQASPNYGIAAELIDSITVENDGTITVVVGAGYVGAGTHNVASISPMAYEDINAELYENREVS